MENTASVRHRAPVTAWHLVVLILVTFLFAIAAKSQRGPKIWLQEPKRLPATFKGSAGGTPKATEGLASPGLAQNDAVARQLAAGQADPLSMARADFDRDGVEDLAVGYRTSTGGAIAIFRGNLDAFAPQSEASFQAIGRSEFPAPFLREAHAFSTPVSPDFVAAGNFTGNGFQDLVVGARGGKALYLYAGDGAGGFGPPQIVSLSGSLTALAAGEFGSPAQGMKLFVGTSDPRGGDTLSVFFKADTGLSTLATYRLYGPASNIAFGDFGDSGPDAAFLSGEQVFVLRSSSMQLVSLSLPIPASAMALGSFFFDRNGGVQIALLAPDGGIQIAARNEFDPRSYTVQEFNAIRRARLRQETPSFLPAPSFPENGWKIVESFPGAASFGSGQIPLFFGTRISSHAGDDLLVLNAFARQLVVVSHPDNVPGAGTFPPGQVSSRIYSATPVQALPMRVNVDGRPGIVTFEKGEVAPSVLMPIPDPTFFVNRMDDPVPTSPIANACNNVSFVDVSSSCSLREAILKANGDTVMVPAGTITLTRARVNGDFTGQHGALYVNNSMTIVGAGQNSTIIQAGTVGFNPGPANGVDMVMAVNEDISPITNATASISNLTLRNGHNRGSHGNDGDGGCMEFDTGSSGNANLFLTNVTLDNCDTTQGNGAGIAIFNFTTPNNGLATISGSIFQNNSAVDSTAGVGAGGGGIWVSAAARMLMSNSQVLNNKATEVNGGGLGIGGGVFIFNNTFGSRQTVIHAGTISGNESAGFGGGIWNSSNLLIDQSSTITGNTAGTNGSTPVANQEGGGIYLDPSSNGCPGACTDSTTLAKVTITGNTASGNGGGISSGVSGGAGNLTMSFNRLTGNVAVAGSNLNNNHTTITATNNWWGTNSPASTINTISGTTTFDPFIALTHTASPSTIDINQSTTLTASFLQDNHGTAISVSNLDVLLGLPITFNNSVLGTLSNAQASIQSNGTATATFTAGSTRGTAHADAVVDNATVTANISIPVAPTISKSFSPTSIPLSGGDSTLTFVITNPNSSTALTSIGFSDTLPSGLIVATLPMIGTNCGGTVTATAGTNVVSPSGVSVGGGGTCNLSVHVTGTAAGDQNNTTGAVTSTEGGTGTTSNTATLRVVGPPAMAKAFSPPTIALNATTSLTFTVTNPSANTVALTGVGFTDTLPTGLTVPNASATVCGGTLTLTAPTGIALTGAAMATSSQCQFSVTVTGAVSGQYTNTTGAVSATNGGTGNTATANLTVASPATIAKAFGAGAIALNGTTSLTMTLTNANTGVSLTGVAFTDSLPAGLVVATPNSLSNTCGGTATAVAGASTASLTAGTLAGSATCTVMLNVTGTTAGVKNNSVQASSTDGGTGNTSNASLTVLAPPVIIKAFGAASIALNGSTSLTFTVQNNNTTTTLTGVGFSDTLPAGLVMATPNGLVGSCGGGTITATQATNVISLSGSSLAQSSSCTFAVNVTGTVAGAQNNTTGAVTSSNGGTGGTASASVNVVGPPTMAKAFSPPTIALNATTSLTFTVTNPSANTVTLTGVSFTDTLPTGLTVPNASATVCGGTLTLTAPTGIALTGAAMATSSQCQFSVTVTGAVSGQYTNTTGAVSATNGGTGNTATANLTVASPATIAKAFGAGAIPLNGTTSLTMTLTNANTGVSLTGVAFTDSLPAGLVVATPNGLSNTCGGTATAVAGASTASLTAGTLAGSATCTVMLNVTGTTAGVKNNSVQASSTEGGTGNTSNATLTIVAPPVIIKAFGAASIALNGSTSLTFTVQNNNTTTTLTGVGFSDTLPGGLLLATPNGLAGSCGGGTITATQGTNVISLSGASLAQSSSCTFAVNVTGTVAGAQNNTTGAVTSSNGGTGGTASASVNVVGPPTMAKAFNPTTIALNATTSLTFTVTNPSANTVTLTGVSFTDTLPTGLVVSTPNGLSSTCNGTATAVAGSTSLSLIGGAIAANTACTVVVNVTGTASGQYTNTTGAVSSTNGGTGNAASANLTVADPPSISKAFGAASIGLAGSTSLNFTITNPNAAVAMTGVAFTDALPAGLVVSTPNGLSGACGSGVIAAAAGSQTVSLTAGTIAASASCSFSIKITATIAGSQVNTTGSVSATNAGTGNTATASINVLAPDLSISKSHSGNFFQGQAGATYSLTVNNVGAGPTAGAVQVDDLLPAGLSATALSGTGWNCIVGTVTCTRNDALAAGSTYPTILVTVSVAASAAASVTNNAIVSGGGELNAANDTATDITTVTSPPDFMLSFTVPAITIRAGQKASYAISVTPQNNVFANLISFTVSGLPAATTFVFTPSSVTPGANPVASTLAVSTTQGDPFVTGNLERSRLPFYGLMMPFAAIVLSGFGCRKRPWKKRWFFAIVLLLSGGLGLYGCVGAQRNFQNLGTPAGTYTVTITATSGALQHSAPVTLIVQP